MTTPMERLVTQLINPVLVVALLASLALTVAPGIALPASAEHVTHSFQDGNPTCTDFNSSWNELTIDGVPSMTTYTDTDGPLTVTISGTPSAGTFDWSSNIGLDAVFVKAADGGWLYTYSPQSTSDSGLHSVAHTNNPPSGPAHDTFHATTHVSAQYHEISHVSFCYDVVTSPTPCCLEFVFLAGTQDEFIGPEPSSPSAGLLAAFAPRPLVGFDEQTLDKSLLHTFVLPPGNFIQSATLEVRAKAGGGLSFNDSICLGFHDTSITNPVCDSQAESFTVLSGQPWINQTQTFTIPLDASLILALDSRRFLDVFIQDDTEVDYLKLTVTFCGAPSPSQPTPVDQPEDPVHEVCREEGSLAGGPGADSGADSTDETGEGSTTSTSTLGLSPLAISRTPFGGLYIGNKVRGLISFRSGAKAKLGGKG